MNVEKGIEGELETKFPFILLILYSLSALWHARSKNNKWMKTKSNNIERRRKRKRGRERGVYVCVFSLHFSVEFQRGKQRRTRLALTVFHVSCTKRRNETFFSQQNGKAGKQSFAMTSFGTEQSTLLCGKQKKSII